MVLGRKSPLVPPTLAALLPVEIILLTPIIIIILFLPPTPIRHNTQRHNHGVASIFHYIPPSTSPTTTQRGGNHRLPPPLPILMFSLGGSIQPLPRLRPYLRNSIYSVLNPPSSKLNSMVSARSRKGLLDLLPTLDMSYKPYVMHPNLSSI